MAPRAAAVYEVTAFCSGANELPQFANTVFVDIVGRAAALGQAFLESVFFVDLSMILPPVLNLRPLRQGTEQQGLRPPEQQEG